MISYQEPGPGIITLPLLDQREAEEVMSGLNRTEAWEPATIRRTSNPDQLAPKVRSAKVAAFDAGSESRLLFEGRIRSIVRPLIYKRWQRDILKHSPLQLIKYLPGDFFVAHRDSGPQFNNRYFTVVCYLNADFEGGGTYFPDSDYTVKPEAGKAVIFPADYLHRADKVIRGEKYVMVAWMLDTPPVQWI